MRTYEKTHPWITFTVNLAEAPAQLWIKLGECQSKCEHISRVPLRPKTAERLHLVYLAKGASATTSIEGNTLTEEQVLLHLEGKLILPPSQQYLQKEVDNIIQACNKTLKDVGSGRIPELSTKRIGDINFQVLEGLSVPEYVIPGRIRTYPVTVGSYRGAPEEDCAYLMDRLCGWLNSETFQAKPGQEIATSILKSVIAHLYIAWIHPFGDGNGRTARLIEFETLIRSGVPAPAAHLLSNHYNQTRTEYYRQLSQASSSGGDILPFVLYAVQGFLDGLQSQLEVIWEQQWDITWRNYVHEQFKEKIRRAADRRRRDLVLELSKHIEPVSLSNLSTLSPQITKAYASRTQKTLLRDINELQRMGLVDKSADGYRAKRELIFSFLPPRARTA